MKCKNILFCLLALIVLFSCKKEPQQEIQVVEKSAFRIAVDHPKTVDLDRKALLRIDAWDEYDAVKNFLNKFSSISPNEALNSSKELSDLVESLHDSIKPKFLENPAFLSRVNFLRTESLRLFDMSTISAIESDEVNTQVVKVLNAYSALNAKINTVVQEQLLDQQIDKEKFGDFMFALDSTSSKKEEKVKNPKNTPKVKKPN